jgi:hypothetical protein
MLMGRRQTPVILEQDIVGYMSTSDRESKRNMRKLRNVELLTMHYDDDEITA